MTGSYKISLYDYLKSLSTVDKQLLMQNLQISSIDYPIVVQAAHRLYWDNLWPAKLRITGDNGKMLLENTTYPGLGLVESVNSLNPRLVLDIGCGQNFYKHKIMFTTSRCSSLNSHLRIHMQITTSSRI